MLDNKGEMSFDMVSFSICKNCIRFIFILLVEIYVIYLYGLEIFRIENSNYDKLDISIFCISLCSLIIDLFSALFFGIGIS